jgi:hypothetical protein
MAVLHGRSLLDIDGPETSDGHGRHVRFSKLCRSVEHYGRLLCMSWRAGVRIMIFFIDSRCGRGSLLHGRPINSINYPQRIARHPFAERGRFSAF